MFLLWILYGILVCAECEELQLGYSICGAPSALFLGEGRSSAGASRSALLGFVPLLLLLRHQVAKMLVRSRRSSPAQHQVPRLRSDRRAGPGTYEHLVSFILFILARGDIF